MPSVSCELPEFAQSFDDLRLSEDWQIRYIFNNICKRRVVIKFIHGMPIVSVVVGYKAAAATTVSN